MESITGDPTQDFNHWIRSWPEPSWKAARGFVPKFSGVSCRAPAEQGEGGAAQCAALRSGWPPGASIFQDEPRTGPGRGRRRGRPRNAVPSGDRTPPCLSPPDRALRAVGRASVGDWAAAGRGRGSGCACRRGRQGAAAASGRRRKSRGARRPRRQRTLAAPAPETRTPPGLNRARPIVAAAALRVPPSGHAWGLSLLRSAGRWHRRQHPKLGAQAGREAAATAGGARPPRGSQQWCSALARSPRPPRGRRGSGRETPPATRSPEFARPASPAGAPLARQRPRRLSPEHGAGARLSLIAPLPPPLAPPVPPVPPVGAASGFSARGSTTLCLSKETGR